MLGNLHDPWPGKRKEKNIQITRVKILKFGEINKEHSLYIPR
jgi:hypothetical protein